jgi:murein DD-endopeptidase MepM/ murein hydrolase activator NlpD
LKIKKDKFRIAAAVAVFVAALVLSCERAPAIRNAGDVETQLLYQVQSVSKKFARNLDRIVFSEGFMKVETREALQHLIAWMHANKYPRFVEFLDSLDQENTRILFEAFLKKIPVESSACAPLAEAPQAVGHETVLCFPFKGEFYVVQGNQGSVSHQKGTRNEYAWDFLIMKDGQMFKNASHKNSNYFAWGLPAIAPAPGRVVEVRADMPDHPPLTTKMQGANYVLIEHRNREISLIYHLMNNSVKVKPGDDVEQGAVVGSIGDSGMSMFPHIHYELDRRNKDKYAPGPARFACYFARREKDIDWHLVISGIPQAGEYLLNIGDYLDQQAGIAAGGR